MIDTQGSTTVPQQNSVLEAILEELEWSRVRLTVEINTYMKRDYICRSTVSEWVNKGRVPHDPLPTVVAHVLSDAVGRKITVADLWQNNGKESLLWIPADYCYSTLQDYRGVLRAAEDWIANTGETMDIDRRELLAISGAGLTGLAWEHADNSISRDPFELQKNISTSDAVTITPGVVNVLEATTKELRNLDDHEGGNRNSLRIAHRHFRTLAEYVKSGKIVDAHTQRRLLTSWATLCELVGMMAFDANLHGLAQRYWFTGLQVTHQTGDLELGAHILGYLSFQAAYRGRANDGVQLGEAAMKMAAQGSSTTVQALVTSRYAQAQAALGNSYACREAINKAGNLLATSGALVSPPDYVSWFDARMFESQSGHSLLALAQKSTRQSGLLIEQAEDLLSPHVASGSDFSENFQRDSLFWGSWQACGYVWRNELEQAVEKGSTLIDLCKSVRSQRCVTVLRQLNNALAERRDALRNPRIGEFSKKLSSAIAAAV